jgi:O-methyltransferase involved in polyketide biosynthesis
MASGSRESWPIVARTHVIDRMVAAQVARGTDVVINLLAGLDTRPYRLRLPASLKWVEVDLPDLLAYKVDRLMRERAACKVERIACDLSDRDSRRELLGKINLRGRHILAIGEGLPASRGGAEASALAEDLHRAGNVRHWIVEIVRPARFGRSEGAAHVERSGWKAIETDSMIETAAKLGRLPWYVKPFTLLAASWTPGRVPSSVCLLERA